MSSKRLFIGLEVPAGAIPALPDPHLPGLRWLPPEQIHLTLGFLGDVAEPKIDLLAEALNQVRVAPFFLPIEGLGSFNAQGRPSVLWVGVGKGHPHLFALHKHIQDAVLHAGLEPDLKAFHPHITVARIKGLSMQALQPLLRNYQESEFGLLKVNDFLLYSSALTLAGAIHHVELRVPLIKRALVGS